MVALSGQQNCQSKSKYHDARDTVHPHHPLWREALSKSADDAAQEQHQLAEPRNTPQTMKAAAV